MGSYFDRNNDNQSKLGEPKDIALPQFYALRCRLQQSPEMQDGSTIKFYERTTTSFRITVMKPVFTAQLRVVLNASGKTASGFSLNDIPYTGPTLQDEISIMLLRFRLPKYVISSDIRRGYISQILLHPDHGRFQLIFWRTHPLHSLHIFQLDTVIFGSTVSSYLAIKCVQQLA